MICNLQRIALPFRLLGQYITKMKHFPAMVRGIIYACCVALSQLCAAQAVLCSGGDAVSNSEGALFWTVGEVVTETVENEGILNQGFQQSFQEYASTNELFVSNGALLYPNPVGGSGLLFLESENKLLSVSIYDSRLRLVKCIQHPKWIGTNQYELNLSDLSEGIYFLKPDFDLFESDTHYRILKL